MTEPLIAPPPDFDDLWPPMAFNEVVDEFFLHITTPRQPTIDALLQKGVPAIAFCHDGDDLGVAIGSACVVVDGDRFDFASENAEGAARAIVAVARDVTGEGRDIIAWLPRQDQVASYRGAVGLLGEHEVDAYRGGEPLRVHRSFLGWLRAGRTGVVVVDRRHAGRVLRDSLGDLAVEDETHAQEVAALLSGTIDLSRIVVPRLVTAQAA